MNRDWSISEGCRRWDKPSQLETFATEAFRSYLRCCPDFHNAFLAKNSSLHRLLPLGIQHDMDNKMPGEKVQMDNTISIVSQSN